MDASEQGPIDMAPAREVPLVPDVLEEFFAYHPPTEDDKLRYQEINDAALFLARVIDRVCPPSADRTHAIRLVREARMTANAAIACRGANYR